MLLVVEGLTHKCCVPQNPPYSPHCSMHSPHIKSKIQAAPPWHWNARLCSRAVLLPLLTLLLTYYNSDKCLGTYGVNKIQNRAELQRSIKGQQSLEKLRKDDALWKPQCGKHGMTRDKTRNPIKQDKRQRSINKPYEFYLLSEWFSFKSTLCESRMKAAE